MAKSVPQKAQGQRYMLDFHCIADRCEDTCCTRWKIVIDQPHHRRLQTLLSTTPEDRAAFETRFSLAPPGARNRQIFAVMVLNDDLRCSFLEGNNLCGLHRRFGESALPNLCTLYPRHLTKVGARFELTTAISCPEAVRKLICHEGADDLVDLPVESLPRTDMAMEVPFLTGDPYLGYTDIVRSAMFRVVRSEGYPVTSRLFFLAAFAQEIRPYFHSGSTQVDKDKMEFELACLDNPDILADLHQRLTHHQAGTPMVLAFAARIFETQLEHHPEAPLSLLLNAWGLKVNADVHPRHLDERLTQALPTLPAEFVARCEQYFAHLCTNYFLRDWYTHFGDLVSYLQVIFIRLGVMRYLMYTHPDLPAAGALPDAAERIAAYDRVAVEVIYRVARSVDHSSSLTESIEKVLDDNKVQNLTNSAFLLRLT